MKLKYTILYVENVEQTLEFYENAFGLKRAMLHEGGDYAELDTGNTTLSLSSLDLMNRLGKGAQRPTKGKPNFEIAFETDDVAGSLQKALDAGAELVQPVEEMPWGQTTSYVHDINGFLIEICSPVSGV
ncbi:putative Glyoxalase/Bleomycin resistance protein/Dihydroxybiphenyl dioxygenase [Vibrio nigripulchritudo MADA3029]|uniref:VOC family protein n=1 Tax=Vibrio TaxID=662 RepID=UPI00021C1EB7|nr:MULTISPECIES: VOC family protein [Vibrio]EGU61740.1 glyoxalase/bleomycin resistance protein/dioxygenase [Vibrio nigripulchritudo ATCC 27043]UAB72648.1 VOC family protein [Vibrio sp. SCSIO 43132]CCN38325.1 putative Glyoxalase/Bleomycin resistance protein/Dihydroxybiphenyl dioxygenase [Vibrio nigripulchritudo AM115]CCN43433.1 putative Glyoxalase/Bleomycin resistance protein/Dihydroxybiphenyl dioxygenase [Vibrio nigripulchritudo FTn2]CCN49884.1 putative Glyoxalase/Bleomycin resistance protein/